MSEPKSNYPVAPTIAGYKEKEVQQKIKGQTEHSEHAGAGKLNLGQDNINAKLEVSFVTFSTTRASFRVVRRARRPTSLQLADSLV